MNVLLIGLVVLFVAIAVFGYAASVAMKILEGIVYSTGSIGTGIINWLGRHDLGCRATIPDILTAPFYDRKPDLEREVMEQYVPKVVALPIPETAIFKGTAKKVFGALHQPTHTMDIAKLCDIGSMAAEPPFESLWNILKQEVHYPVSPPSKPPDLPSPPLWTPWRAEIPAPVFEPPLYVGSLSFLNRFVYAAHKGEADRVAAARVWKMEIEEATRKRNAEMERLAEKASARWDKAKTEREESFVKAMALYNQDAQAYEKAFHTEQALFRSYLELSRRPGPDGLLTRIDLALRTMLLPDAVPREAESRFDIDSGVLIHEQRFPDLSELECVKLVEQKAGHVSKPVNQKERKEVLSKLWPAICLRLACEIARRRSSRPWRSMAGLSTQTRRQGNASGPIVPVSSLLKSKSLHLISLPLTPR